MVIVEEDIYCTEQIVSLLQERIDAIQDWPVICDIEFRPHQIIKMMRPLVFEKVLKEFIRDNFVPVASGLMTGFYVKIKGEL